MPTETLTPTIRIKVDPTNPGQFFACCGLLELADRLWPGAEGWFVAREFCIHIPNESIELPALLSKTRTLAFEVGDDSETESDSEPDDLSSVGRIEPIRITWDNGEHAIDLDWWADKSIKPWAGSMKERVILRAMLDAIDPTISDPFNDMKRVLYQSPRIGKNGKISKAKKKELFYFDPRRGNKSHPLDCGFSPDTHKMECECCPAVEALCFIGLQRSRPTPTRVANQSSYTLWFRPMASQLTGAIAGGLLYLGDSPTYVFTNYFRTDQRKHKTFSIATIERYQNV